MKKIVVIVLSVLLGVLALFGCDDRTDRINAYSRMNPNAVGLTLPFKPISATTYGFGTSFSSEKTLDEIKVAVLEMKFDNKDKHEKVSAEVYGSYLVICYEVAEPTAQDFSKYYFTVIDFGESSMYPNAHYYKFEEAYLMVSVPSEEDRGHITMPLHMLQVEKNYQSDYVGQSNTPYQTTFGIQDFQAFYQNTVYHTAVDGNVLTLTPKAPQLLNESHFKGEVKITFETIEQVSYATYTA